jgi:hypothetical protein
MCSRLKNITLKDQPRDFVADILKFMTVESIMESFVVLVAVSDVTGIVMDYKKNCTISKAAFFKCQNFHISEQGISGNS